MTKTTLGHGMSGELETKDWHNITQSDLEALKIHYTALQGNIEILWNSPRPFSSAALIRVNKQHIFFIKRSDKRFRSTQDIEEEHQFIVHLASKQIPVPNIVPTSLGTTALQQASWTYELHYKAKGQDLYANHHSWQPFLCHEHANEAGKIQAKMHLAAQSFSVKKERAAQFLVSNQRLLEAKDITLAIKNKISASSALSQYFKETALRSDFLEQTKVLHQSIYDEFKKVPKIWTHNDLHASNIFWKENGEIATVIDFGLSDFNSAVYDFTVAVERNFFDWLQLSHSQSIDVDFDGLKVFCLSYIKTLGYVPSWLSLVPELLGIIHLDFAFSELEYFVGITQNLKHADAAYFDWIIAHTAWFFSDAGQDFIAELKTFITQVKAGDMLSMPT